MKYTKSVTIRKKRNEVVDLMQSREAALVWMEGLKEFTLVEGELGEENSRYKMVFENKGKQQVMYETVLEVSPPEKLTTVYEMGGVKNICFARFFEDGNNTTYEMETDFKFKFPINIFIWLFTPMFKKETIKGMNAFKEYCEKDE